MYLAQNHTFWAAITRLGEAQILLPAALTLALWFAWRCASPRLALTWLAGIAVAAVVTTASKVAFIGFGIGWPALDFTGLSGHAVFAAAIYPLAGAAVASALSRRRAGSQIGMASGGGSCDGSRGPSDDTRDAGIDTDARSGFGVGVGVGIGIGIGIGIGVGVGIGISLGAALAVVVAVSRLAVNAHSGSEVIAGLLVGAAVSAAALRSDRLPHWRPPLWLPLTVALWLGLSPAHAPPSTTHDMVTRLSLKCSGRSAPYTRPDLHAVPTNSEAPRRITTPERGAAR